MDDKPSPNLMPLVREMMDNQDLIEQLTKRIEAIEQSAEITRRSDQWEKDHGLLILPPPSTSDLTPQQMASLEKFARVPADERPEVQVLKSDELLKMMEEVRADRRAEVEREKEQYKNRKESSSKKADKM